MKVSMLSVAFVATLAALSNAMAILDDAIPPTVPVNVENYNRAESDTVIRKTIATIGSIGNFSFYPSIVPVISDVQLIVRPNQDVVYGSAVFDLSESVTFTLPAVPSSRYYSFYALNEDNFALEVVYPDSKYPTEITLQKCPNAFCLPEIVVPCLPVLGCKRLINSDTRYVFILVRVAVNPGIPADLAAVDALLKAVVVKQKSIGEFVAPNWDQTSLAEVRAGFAALGPFLPPLSSFNARRGEIDEVVHQIATATFWGDLPIKDAFYQLYYPPALTEANAIYMITVPKDVPIASNAFWSVTVYNQNGFLQFNPVNTLESKGYAVNSIRATREADGSVIIYLSQTQNVTYMKNWIEIYPGWNYAVRMYKPQASVLNGQFQFPSLVQVQ